MPRARADRPANTNVFGDRLRQLREARGWSQHALAAKAEISQSLLATLEAGTKQPGWETVQSLADALGVKTEAFRR